MDSTLNSITASVEQRAPQAAEATGNRQSSPVGDLSSATSTNAGEVGEVIDVSSLEQRGSHPERFLYTELARAHLGERAAAVVDLLVGLGRLSVREIADRLPSLSIRDVKTVIVSLIQLRCVKHVDESGLSGKITTYYYYNEDGFMIFLYSGLIVEEIGSSFPMKKDSTVNKAASAVAIIQTVLSLGSLSLRDYFSTISTNTAEEQEPSQHEIIDTFVKLCETGFLIPINKLHYTPINDLWNMLYEKEYKLIPRNSVMSDLKKRNEAKGKAKLQFIDLLNSEKDLSKIIIVDQRTSLRTVKDQIPLTFNIDRFLKLRRTKHLSQFAKSRIGKMSALVYNIALKLTEQKSPPLVNPLTKTGLLQDLDEAESIHDELELAEEKNPGLTFTAVDLAKHLPASLDLRGGLVSVHKSNSGSNKRGNENADGNNNKRLKTKDGFVIPSLPQNIAPKKENADDDEAELKLDLNSMAVDLDDDSDIDTDDNDDPHSIMLIQNHLKLLSNSSIPFLREAKPGSFHVPYSKLIPSLRSSIYDYIITSTMGQSAMRIRRCIQANKLASEKVINSTALMKEKDIRSTISSLIKYNVVEIQEVPRTVDRSAARAIFLFRIKEKHSYQFMKQNLAWNIANLLHKKEILKEENNTLLTKASREDVRGKEAELLLPSELNQLKMVKERETTAYARISRIISLWEIFNFI